MAAVKMFSKTIIFVFMFAVTEFSSCHELGPLQSTVPLIDVAPNKQFYLGVNFKTTWWRANQFCLSHGMKLATIESAAENDILGRAISDIGHNGEFFFTSGTDMEQEGRFHWMTTGLPVGYTNWGPGEPSDLKLNTSVENCLAVIMWSSGLYWHDLHCTYEKYFVCEIRSSS